VTAVRDALRRWRGARKARKVRKYADEQGHLDPAELQRLRDQQSPFKARWGYYPK
jgi:hypothetical protein